MYGIIPELHILYNKERSVKPSVAYCRGRGNQKSYVNNFRNKNRIDQHKSIQRNLKSEIHPLSPASHNCSNILTIKKI